MIIVIGALEFDGPYFDCDMLSDEPGIFAVLAHRKGEFELIELNDAEHVREYLQLHEEREAWHEHELEIAFAVHYTPDLTSAERHEIVNALEQEFDVEFAA